MGGLRGHPGESVLVGELGAAGQVGSSLPDVGRREVQHATVEQRAGQLGLLGPVPEQADRRVEITQRGPASSGPQQQQATLSEQDTAALRPEQRLGRVQQTEPHVDPALLGLGVGQADQHPSPELARAVRQQPQGRAEAPGGERRAPTRRRRDAVGVQGARTLDDRSHNSRAGVTTLVARSTPQSGVGWTTSWASPRATPSNTNRPVSSAVTA